LIISHHITDEALEDLEEEEIADADGEDSHILKDILQVAVDG
jgi:hypothetical protein